MGKNTFNKDERLTHKKLIDALFKSGTSVKSFPILMVWNKVKGEGMPIAQVGFSVPKRSFKKAVDRNLLKRRMREAYRLNKNIMEGVAGSYAMMLIYMGKESKAYDEIETAIREVLQKWVGEISEH